MIVTPFVGVWIETSGTHQSPCSLEVTPFVGVWIETMNSEGRKWIDLSHPSWVCGLKLHTALIYNLDESHTLRGCVD